MYSENRSKARVTRVSIVQKPPVLEQRSANRNTLRLSDRLTRNFLSAALLVVCIYAIKTAQVPDGDVLETAAKSITELPWEENLGRIQYVTHMFPETQSVFWSNINKADYRIQAGTQIMHAWTEDEPYISIRTDRGIICSLTDGTVRDITYCHDNTITVTVLHDSNFTSTYYCLAACSVSEGDVIYAGNQLGIALQGTEIPIELRQDGLPSVPNLLFENADAAL